MKKLGNLRCFTGACFCDYYENLVITNCCQELVSVIKQWQALPLLLDLESFTLLGRQPFLNSFEIRFIH
jgi:hypothetical protein